VIARVPECRKFKIRLDLDGQCNQLKLLPFIGLTETSNKTGVYHTLQQLGYKTVISEFQESVDIFFCNVSRS